MCDLTPNRIGLFCRTGRGGVRRIEEPPEGPGRAGRVGLAVRGPENSRGGCWSWMAADAASFKCMHRMHSGRLG